MAKSFSEVKAEFDKLYSSVDEYDCFLPEHLSIGKKTNFRKKMALTMSNIINGNSYMALSIRDCSPKIILVRK